MALGNSLTFFKTLVLIASPSITILLCLSLFGTFAALLLMAQMLVSGAQPIADGLGMSFGTVHRIARSTSLVSVLGALAILSMGPMGLGAILQLGRLLVAVNRDGIAVLDRRRKTIVWGLVLGTLPLLAVLAFVSFGMLRSYSMKADGSMSGGLIGLVILSGAPVLPLVVFLALKAIYAQAIPENPSSAGSDPVSPLSDRHAEEVGDRGEGQE